MRTSAPACKIDETGVSSIHPKSDRTFASHSLLAYAGSVLLILFAGSAIQLHDLNIGLLVTEIAFIALPACIVLLRHRKAVSGTKFKAPTPSQLSLTAVVGICAAVIAVYRGLVSREAILGVDASDADITAGLSLPLVWFLAPLCEELLFRPTIQNGLAHRWSARTAVILTALLFALFHLSVLRFAETFVIGLFAGIVFLKTGNFWCPVVVHFLCNALGPVLWRHATGLNLLLNPVAAIGLAGIALTACYFLGGKSPSPLKGWWNRLRWVAFGTTRNSIPTPERSRAATVLLWVILPCMLTLLGVGHALTLNQFNPKFDYVVTEEDEWTLASAGEIHARSELEITKFPETDKDLVVSLPFSEAVIEDVSIGGSSLPFSQKTDRQYRIERPPGTAQSEAILVRWRFPITALDHSDRGYRTPLESLAPSEAYSLKWTTTTAAGLHTEFLFRQPAGTSKPKVNYGSCGIDIRK